MRTRHDVSGVELTTLRVGGPIKKLVDVSNEADLLQALQENPEAVVLGGGSNLLIADEGYDGTVIRAFSPGREGVKLEPSTGFVHVEAPVEWDVLVQCLIEADLQGLESTSGVPGSVGGAIVQNLGAYGQETADVVHTVDVFDREENERRTLEREECEFEYRSSRFKHDSRRRFVITSAVLQMQHGATALPRYGDVTVLLAERHEHDGPYALAEIREAVLEVRRSKGMVLGASDPSAGSFFTNPVLDDAQVALVEAEGLKVVTRADGVRLTSAATLMEAAGFTKGHADGAAGLSSLHVLALVNRGGATTTDVVRLARRVRAKVHERFGIWLTPEPVLLGFAVHPFEG